MFAPSRQIEFFEISDDFRQSSSEARPAKTSAAQTPKAKASKERVAASTSKQSASSESAVLVGSLLKTALICELGALTPSSLRWKHSATPAGRSWYVLETSVPTTSGPEAGSSVATSPKFHTPTTLGNMHHPSMSKWESRIPWRIMLSTPRASDMKAGGHGDTGRMGTVRHQLARASSTMLPTPTATRYGSQSYPEDPSKKRPSLETLIRPETLPTPTKRDKRMDAWSPAYDKRKSPTMDAVLDGAMRDRASDKWQYARQIAAALQNGGLTGPSMTLPLTYNWMMGFPPGWLARALRSAVQKELLPQVSLSKRSAMPSSRKSPKL